MVDRQNLVPRMAGVLDDERLQALSLAAVDRFVLSLVDGATSVRNLADAVGLSSEEVLASLLKLESMQIVVIPSPSPVADSPAVTAPASPTAEGEVDLEPEHRREIDEMFSRIDTLDHYGLLGLGRTADRKAVKRAYFERTSRFHPDRFFRKRLGAFKLKMEVVFGRMTEAHDTLASSERRAEYDAYLGSLEKTQGVEQMLAQAALDMKRTEEALALDGRSSVKVLPIPEARVSPTPARTEPSDVKARRELLARRLTGGGGRVPGPRIPTPIAVPSPTTTAPSASAYTRSGDAVDALKRRYEERVSAARTAQARKYTESGLAARAKGDMVAAANGFRVALSFDPESTELKTMHAEAQRAADEILVEQYLKQAQYEERSERWADAGRSWARVARTQTSNAKAHERAAFCLLKAGGDLHEAAALGQRGVQLEPKNASFRRTMANVYLGAGLTLNAKRELDAALQLAPDDATTIALLKRIAKST